MLENKKGVESLGGKGLGWAGKVRRFVGESSRVCGRGKCVVSSGVV